MTTYAHPEFLVETGWVAENHDDPAVRIIESDEDPLLYDMGHIPGAARVDWFTTLQNPLKRDFLSKEEFEKLAGELGLTHKTLVVFYGDKSNWFACYALWLFMYYGHQKVAIMNGGRAKWEKEGRAFTKEKPTFSPTQYSAEYPNRAIRAYRNDVFRHIEEHKALVDVRSPKEYSGELLHMANYPQEGATRGGHIPGAVNIPWAQAVNESDSTFKAPTELLDLYKGHSITPNQDVIAYCRIGERSSLTWFVLKFLLGYANVRNYDGSWTEWGNLVDAPIEK